MFLISDEQLSTMGKESFIDRSINFMTKTDDTFKSLDFDKKRTFISLCTDIALNEYEFITERAVMTYILVSWTLGPDFASSYPNLEKILTDKSTNDLNRAEKLYQQVLIILEKEE
jgi:hypothetical protein